MRGVGTHLQGVRKEPEGEEGKGEEGEGVEIRQQGVSRDEWGDQVW